MNSELDVAVRVALARIEAGSLESVEQVRKDLHDAMAVAEAVPRTVAACVEAADEHLSYGELMEARMLLTVAHGLLAPSRLYPTAVLPTQPTRAQGGPAHLGRAHPTPVT